MSLRIRIALAVAILGSLLVGAVLSITLTDLLHGIRHQLRVSEQVMLDLLADHSREALLTEDYGDLQAHLERATRHPRLRAALVADTRGHVVVATDPSRIGTLYTPPSDGNGNFWRVRNINGQVNPLGTMAIEFSDRPYVEAYQRARTLGLTVAGIGVAASALIGLLIGHFLTVRLHALADAADRIGSHSEPVLLPLRAEGADEVARLTRALASMVGRLRENYETLRAARDRLQHPTEAMSQGFALWDAGDRLLLCNRRFCEFFADTAKHCLEGMTFAEVSQIAQQSIAPDSLADGNDWRARRIAYHRNPDGVFLISLKNGRFIEVREAPTSDGGTVAIYTDVTDERRRQLELLSSERRLRAMMDSVFDAVVTTDAQGRIESLNPSAERIFGWCRKDALGLPVSVLLAAAASETAPRASFDQLLEIAPEDLFEMEGRHRSGRIFPIEVSAARIEVDDRLALLFTIRDISERKAHELRIVHHATHDRLTALPNRTLLEQRLDEALQQTPRGVEAVAVMFLDLDRFKAINDDLGHHVGDTVLVGVAERLRTVAKPPHMAARLGGDEFILLARIEAGGSARDMAGRVLEELRRPFHVRGRELSVMASVGISVYPGHGESAEALFRHADLALYQAKSAGKDRIAFYRPDLGVRGRRHSQMEAHLRRALREGDLVLHYQPEIDLASGEICCLEALTRWPHAELGVVPPDEFIPIAEESALVAALGRWVLDGVCRDIGLWRQLGLKVPRVAINVSARELEGEGFAAHLLNTLERQAIAPDQIELELTERMLMREGGLRDLERLAEAGIRLTLDDFGTGYWSLSHLKRCPIRRLKIDRSFIQGLKGSARDVPLIQATIAMAEALEIEVVAEGIEDPDQWHLLLASGCRLGQGFFICRPLPLGEITGLLSRSAPLLVSAHGRVPDNVLPLRHANVAWAGDQVGPA